MSNEIQPDSSTILGKHKMIPMKQNFEEFGCAVGSFVTLCEQNLRQQEQVVEMRTNRTSVTPACIQRISVSFLFREVCVYLILHHGPLLCRPAVVGIMWHCGGAAKVTQLDGALVTNQEVLNLQHIRGRLIQLHRTVTGSSFYARLKNHSSFSHQSRPTLRSLWMTGGFCLCMCCTARHAW